jgi:UMF1 family MFS transporter
MARVPVAPSADRKRSVVAWIVYDIAAHGYTLMIPGVAYPIYFMSHVAYGHSGAHALWSFAVALPLVLSGFFAPWIGAVADARGRRRLLLTFATLLCCAATASLFGVSRGDIAAGIASFVLAQLGYMMAAGLYNSYLPHIAPIGRTARLSGLAWGLSYIGGLACLALCLPFTRDGLGPDNVDNFRNTFLVTAAFFLLFGLPAAAALPADIPVSSAATPARPYRRIWQTVREWRREREIPKFLLAFYLVNDAVVTVIFFTAITLKQSFGLDVQEVLVLSIAFQLIAIPSTIFFGWLGGRWTQRGALYVTLAVWGVALGLLAFGEGRYAPVAIAVALGLVLGSTQTLFRSLFAVMVPADRVAEYFGFHALAGPRLIGARAAVVWSGQRRDRQPAARDAVAWHLSHRRRHRAGDGAHSPRHPDVTVMTGLA